MVAGSEKVRSKRKIRKNGGTTARLLEVLSKEVCKEDLQGCRKTT